MAEPLALAVTALFFVTRRSQYHCASADTKMPLRTRIIGYTEGHFALGEYSFHTSAYRWIFPTTFLTGAGPALVIRWGAWASSGETMM